MSIVNDLFDTLRIKIKAKKGQMMAESKGGITGYFGSAFWQIGNAWKRQAAAVLKQYDITYVQFIVLKAIFDLDSKESIIRQSDIAVRLRTNPMVISSVVRALKKKKLIGIRTHPKDTRAKQVILNDNGQQLIQACCDHLGRHEIAFFEPVSTDIESFVLNLAKLAAAHPFSIES